MIRSAEKLLNRIMKDQDIADTANRLSDVNMLFQRIRSAFRVPENGNLSHNIGDDSSIHEHCNAVIGEMEVYLHVNISDHEFSAIKYIAEKYHERGVMLFANNPEYTIPRTNNSMEQFFRKLRRNVRKRNGNTATGNILAQIGVQLALFQNLDNPEYVRIVFGSKDMPAVFADHRKHFRKPGMTVDSVNRLVEKGTIRILEGNLSDTPYNDEIMDIAMAQRNANTS